jgi:hypothetical protein
VKLWRYYPLSAIRVFQKINDPKPVIASETKCREAISKTLRLLHYASLRDATANAPFASDNWAFFYLEYSKLNDSHKIRIYGNNLQNLQMT